MPYKSLAQARLFNSKNSPVSRAVVDEFNAASKGKMGTLPYHSAKSKLASHLAHFRKVK